MITHYIKTIYIKVRHYALGHKKTSIMAALLIAVALWYIFLSDGSAEVRYVLATAKRGDIVVSVTGSGQVSASAQVDIKSKVSGDVIYVGANDRDAVEAGFLITQLDARNAQKTVRDAEVSLLSARIALEKIKGADDLMIPRNKQQAEDDLAKAYDDGFNATANV